MGRNDIRMDGPISNDQLEFLAAISPEWREEKRRRERAADEAVRQQKQDEFVRAITRPNWPGTERAMTEEEVDKFVEAITSRGGLEIHEAGWDASKHPRRGGPPNAGWWASTSGGSGGASSTTSNSPAGRQTAHDRQANSDTSRHASSYSEPSQSAPRNDRDQNNRTIHATTAEFSPSQGAPAHLIGSSSVGHHWIPQSVFGELESQLTGKALKIFEMGTEDPGVYNHAFDTWREVTHDKYNRVMRKLLKDWIKLCGKRKLTEEDARKFLSWIASGKCDDAAFLAAHEKEFAAVFAWRAGFNESVVVAKAALAENPNLTAAELKAIAQVFVNGKSSGNLTRRAARVVQAIVKNGKGALKAIAKKVLPGLMALSAATAAKRGWAGEGHTGSGAWGALNEVARDAAAAELVEKMAFPTVLHTVDGLVNLIAPGLNDPTRYRILWRNGVRVDMRTGQPVE